MASFVAEASLNSFDKVYLIALSPAEIKQQIHQTVVVKKLNYYRTNSHLKNTMIMFKTAMELRKIVKDINPDIICSLGTITLFVSQIAALFKKQS
ncbi:hypothetical protein Q73_13500 [Bacillus coahuilensis m2-6]|uniref:glycosyltransferase n=1 Tax=Bacillus coahuilensis TaxID=408580 RepID=UPI00075044CB|nr:glycosyltransferase [Bacillus coahuilensis]KUP05095.1 hypothetical protein Q73_13500 [Bacillus coahuilensis m2-6]